MSRVEANPDHSIRVQSIHNNKINEPPCGPALCLFLLTVIPGGGGISDVTCITDVSSIEYMRTYKYDDTTENRYLLSSVTLSPTYSIPPPQETHPTINLPISFVKVYFSSRGWG